VNPYVAATLAMCVIVALSLAGTAYLAVVFNRKAKADLEAALTPLAEAIDGELDLDGAIVKGRREGGLVFGRVATGPGGMGRLFHVDRIDAAGGVRWEWSSLPAKQPGAAPTRAFESADPSLERRLGIEWETLAGVVPNAASERFGFMYEPGPGHVRLTRAMRSRRDIPDAATFLRQLDALAEIGNANRRVQQGVDDAGASVPPDEPRGIESTA
jgi:hypothetical protein